MPYFSNAGERLYYEDSGRGKPVVLIHSLGGCGAMWETTIEALSNRYRVLAFDSRGHGRSSYITRFSIANNAADASMLLDEVGIEAAALVGISMGGHTAQVFAARWPKRVLALVLADTSVGGGSGGPARVEAVKNRIAQVGYEAFAREYVMSRLMPQTPVKTRNRYIDFVVSMADGAYVDALTSITQQDLRPGLASITAPTLVLVGESDASTPPNAAEELAKGISGARCEVILRANHFSNLDQPDSFNTRVREFLDKTL